MDLLPAGQYRGKVTSYGIGETQAGDPQVVIKFDVYIIPPDATLAMLEEGTIDAADISIEEMSLYSSLKGGAIPITLDTVLKLGLKPGKEIVDLAEGVEGGALEIERFYGLSIKDNRYNDKVTSKISSVYRQEDGAPGVTLDRETAQAKLSAIPGLSGDLQLRRAQMQNTAPANAAKGPANAPAAPKAPAAGPKSAKKPGF